MGGNHMSKNLLKKMAVLALLAAVAAACANNGGTGGNAGSGDPPAAQEPAGDSGGAGTGGDGAGGEDADEAGSGRDGAGGEGTGGADGDVSILPAPADLKVEIGQTREIETQIEGMTEKVNVIEYTLLPYGIKFALRDMMEGPEVLDGQAVFVREMGENLAIVTVSVAEGADLEAAAAEAAAIYSDGFEAGEAENLDTKRYPYPGKSQHFRKEGYYYGFDVVDVNGLLLVIHHAYPFDAGDGMGAVMHEMLASIELEGK